LLRDFATTTSAFLLVREEMVYAPKPYRPTSRRAAETQEADLRATPKVARVMDCIRCNKSI
jgi:hypothetical protein